VRFDSCTASVFAIQGGKMKEIPHWYLEWCSKNEELQNWWRFNDGQSTPWKVNARVGDRFLVGPGIVQQFGFIAGLQWNAPLRNLPTYMRYELCGDIGGWGFFRERELPNCFYWIPTIDQLLEYGYEDIATKLWETFSAKPLRIHDANTDPISESQAAKPSSPGRAKGNQLTN
jgi:hypothetical protein